MIIPFVDHAGEPRRRNHVMIVLLVIQLVWLVQCHSALAVEPSFGYYDEVPPFDQGEADALRERVQEGRKRLKRESDIAIPREPTQPLPSPPKDEREGVPPIDFHEVDELRRAFAEVQAQKPGEEAPRDGRPPPGAPRTGMEAEVDALSKRLRAIERVVVGTEERPGLGGLIGGWTRHNGFFLMSGDGDFFLRLPGLIQTDLRTFPYDQNGANPGVHPSTFILQRVRPMVHFRLWRYFRGFMTPDFGNGFTQDPNVQGRVQTPDAFGEWDYYSAFRVRIGKFKSPVGLEMLRAPQNLSFMERSLTRNLLPNRDVGAMVWGLFDHGLLEYQVGVFNGVPNANFYQESRAFSSGKTMVGRFFSRPFLHRTTDWMRGFGIGAGMSYGSVRQNNGQDPMQTETFSYTFFQYLPQVTGDGDRWRLAPQMAWYWKRFGLLAEYVLSSQRLRRDDTHTSARTTHDAWSAQVSWLLTDDTATFGHLEPRRPLAPSQGQWGAWEVAVRYAQLNIDSDAFTFGLADPGINAQRAKSTTIGLNWYLNSYVRIAGNFVHTDFTGATSAYRAASHENGLMFRAQLTF